ncbi:MAG: YihY family inner membrane protein, partial [Deltaproteobacteria bacterium]|nr:YihY family inner membrane protein [Deltaproteobacteria bacterium]
MKLDPRALYHQLTSSEGGRPGLAIPRAVVRWAVLFYRQMEADKAFIRAGGMTYITLVALVPVLVLIFGVLHATGLLEPNQEAVEQLLTATFLSEIPEVTEFLLPGLMGIDLAALGIVGVIVLLIVSSRLYLMVERAYNDIFGAYVDRPLGQRLLNFYFTLTLLPVGLGVALLGTEDLLGGFPLGRWLTTAVTFGMLLAALKLFPCTRVRWRASIAGAVVSTILLMFGGQLFPLYVRLFASDNPLQVVYGSLGLIPVFLLWLYLLWVFVLIGVEVAYVGQNFRSLAEAEFDQSEYDQKLLRVPSVPLAIEVAARVGRSFQEGGGALDLDVLASATGCPSRELRPVVHVLERGGFLLRTEEGWTVSRPASEIRLEEIVRHWREQTSVRPEERDLVGDAFYAVINERLSGSLADAIERWVIAVEEESAYSGVSASASESTGGGSTSNA